MPRKSPLREASVVEQQLLPHMRRKKASASALTIYNQSQGAIDDETEVPRQYFGADADTNQVIDICAHERNRVVPIITPNTLTAEARAIVSSTQAFRLESTGMQIDNVALITCEADCIDSLSITLVAQYKDAQAFEWQDVSSVADMLKTSLTGLQTSIRHSLYLRSNQHMRYALRITSFADQDMTLTLTQRLIYGYLTP